MNFSFCCHSNSIVEQLIIISFVSLTFRFSQHTLFGSRSTPTIELVIMLIFYRNHLIMKHVQRPKKWSRKVARLADYCYLCKCTSILEVGEKWQVWHKSGNYISPDLVFLPFSPQKRVGCPPRVGHPLAPQNTFDINVLLILLYMEKNEIRTKKGDIHVRCDKEDKEYIVERSKNGFGRKSNSISNLVR